MTRMRLRVTWLAVALSPAMLCAQAPPTTRQIDPQKSVITVRVFKGGLFAAFGHEHDIQAPVQKGAFSEAARTVELTVDARSMRVLDRDVSAKDRAEIQETMLGPKVLDSARFPEIRFRSTAVESTGSGHWIVNGELTLHGQTRPVTAEVQGRSGGGYQGSAELKQKDFGITPVTVGGGAVKVKNELRVEFEIFVQP